MLTLDPIQTLAFGGVCLLIGYLIRRRVRLLSRFNIPAPVIGGLLVALVLLACQQTGYTPLHFDNGLQQPLMIAFFTSIGFSASVSLLRVSGRQMVLFLGLATVLLIVQNIVGVGLASAFGLPPLFGVVVGSATLAGGPATGLAFAPLFEQAGVHGAHSIAMASAMAGIVCGSLLGAPLATLLIERYNLRPKPSADLPALQAGAAQAAVVDSPISADDKPDSIYAGVKSLVLVLLAMGIGAWIAGGFGALGITLPSYIGAMLIGAVLRNIDDRFGWFGLTMRHIHMIGSVSLSLFLVVALMNLHLWELSGLAMPLLVNLAVQTIIVLGFCFWPLLMLMGRDYDATVMAGGFVGFMLGITANAIAVMESLVERYGPAPRAFLVAPLVGGFLIDFTNAIAITVFINIYS